MPDELRERILTVIDEALKGRIGLLNFYIAGVEVTQAIQYCNAAEHLTDPADRGPDNSIRLVADKPACVRVYVRSGNRTPGVMGAATLQRKRKGLWTDVATLMQLPPASVTVEVSPGYATERGQLTSSVNFLIPTAAMRGHMRLKVHVEVPGTTLSADTDLMLDVSMSPRRRFFRRTPPSTAAPRGSHRTTTARSLITACSTRSSSLWRARACRRDTTKFSTTSSRITFPIRHRRGSAAGCARSPIPIPFRSSSLPDY
jgi:hypothetical protein